MTPLRQIWSYDDQVLGDFIKSGRHVFSDPVDPAAAGDLLAAIHAERAFDSGLFLSQAEFDADPQHVGVNPKPGRNMLDRYAGQLGFVERAPQIVEALGGLLGDDYQILNRKIVCGVPERHIPDWLIERVKGNPVNNLGAYVRPQFRDVTYFYGIDFHQDLIDYKERSADFITLYVYLHPVGRQDAPLYLLDGSHALGATVFPHDLRSDGPGHWIYGDRRGQERLLRQEVLTGPAGRAAMWHACTLHGTQPDAADHERISLRYLVARRHDGPTGLDAVNARLQGPLSLTDTRADLAADGSAAIKSNTVLKA